MLAYKNKYLYVCIMIVVTLTNIENILVFCSRKLCKVLKITTKRV